MASGAKKILGKVHFFGVWSSPDAAHQHYLRVAEDLHAGRTPALAAEGEFTVKELGNQFLTYRQERVETKQIGARWLEDCRRVIEQFARFVGTARTVVSLTPADFARFRRLIATRGLRGGKALGVHSITHTLVAVQAMFNWAVGACLLEKPPRYGPAFNMPVLRFTQTAWAKLQFFCHYGETENGGFGVTAPDAPLLVEDFITVKQVVTAISVAFDDLAVADYFEEQVDLGRKPEQFARIWLHTHPGNKAIVATALHTGHGVPTRPASVSQTC